MRVERSDKATTIRRSPVWHDHSIERDRSKRLPVSVKEFLQAAVLLGEVKPSRLYQLLFEKRDQLGLTAETLPNIKVIIYPCIAKLPDAV